MRCALPTPHPRSDRSRAHAGGGIRRRWTRRTERARGRSREPVREAHHQRESLLMSTPEEVLAAHYAAFPHVAKQLKVGEASPAPATAVHDKQAPAGAAGLPAADPRAMPLIAEVRAYTVEVKKKRNAACALLRLSRFVLTSRDVFASLLESR